MAPAWRDRRARIVETLAQEAPDVVALQECAWRLRPQSMQIARKLGMRWGWAGTLGIASRERIRVNRRPLPARGRGGSKRVLCATVGPMRIWVVHLPLDPDVRIASARSFVALADASPGPIVVCGDFNERPGAPAVTELRNAGFTDAWTGPEGFTWPTREPLARIDFVLVRDVEVVGAHLLRPDPPASDHFGLAVDLA